MAPEDDDSTSIERKKETLRRAFGDVAWNALNDPKTVEVLLNADGQLWQERLGEKMKPIGRMGRNYAEAVVRAVAGILGKEVTRFSPLLEGEFPLDGSRFAAQYPPVVPAPTFAIRKKAVAVFTLDDYVSKGIMTALQCALIKETVGQHRNILVIGGTGSGKTTLVNAIIAHMVVNDPTERLILIEDTGEIQCAAVNSVPLHTTPEVTMTMLLRASLRMRPDRILVGEVRGPEALDLLMAWNTGHEGGAATLHANNARAGLKRLEMLVSMHPDSPHPLQPLIAEAVDVVVHIGREEQGRRVKEILQVKGFEDGQYVVEQLQEA
jgi:type IV secretion system protein TrbB